MCLTKFVLSKHLGRSWRVPRAPSYGGYNTRGAASNALQPKIGCLAGAWDDGNQKFKLTEFAKELDSKSKGKITQHIQELASQLTLGKAFVVSDVLPNELNGVAIASLGPYGAGFNEQEALDEGRENVRIAMGAATQVLLQNDINYIKSDPCNAPDAAAEALALAKWSVQKFTGEVRPEVGGESKGDNTAGSIRGEAQNWARYLCEMPPNLMTPTNVGKQAEAKLGPLGVKVQAHNHDWIQKTGMNALLAVANGSCEPPVFLECVYNGGDPKKPPVLLSAKGTTFDSGGICLLPPECMIESRGTGLAGAAVALGALLGLAKLKAKVNVACVVPLCENMISGQSMRVGDIFNVDKKWIQVERTDLEGPIMLADTLAYGQQIYKPSLVVNVASLTRAYLFRNSNSHQVDIGLPGSVMQATGGGAFGCFTDSDTAWALMQKAGAVTGDRPWRLPVWDYYYHQLTYLLMGQMRNTGPDRATACLGAAFLKKFVPGDFVHMDITGVGVPGRARGPTYLDPKYMTGRPTRTLIQFLSEEFSVPLSSRGGAGAADQCQNFHQYSARDTPTKEASARGKGPKDATGSRGMANDSPVKEDPLCGKGPKDAPGFLRGMANDPPIKEDPLCGKGPKDAPGFLRGMANDSPIKEDPLCGKGPKDAPSFLRDKANDQPLKKDPLCRKGPPKN